MKKIAALLVIVTITGCSGMGMSTSGSSGMSSMSSRGTSVNQNPVTDAKGNLNIYHGG